MQVRLCVYTVCLSLDKIQHLFATSFTQVCYCCCLHCLDFLVLQLPQQQGGVTAFLLHVTYGSRGGAARNGPTAATPVRHTADYWTAWAQLQQKIHGHCNASSSSQAQWTTRWSTRAASTPQWSHCSCCAEASSLTAQYIQLLVKLLLSLSSMH